MGGGGEPFGFFISVTNIYMLKYMGVKKEKCPSIMAELLIPSAQLYPIPLAQNINECLRLRDSKSHVFDVITFSALYP